MTKAKKPEYIAKIIKDRLKYHKNRKDDRMWFRRFKTNLKALVSIPPCQIILT